MANRRAQRLFISYAHEDSELADHIAAICKGLGVRCFLDHKDITWGKSIGKAVSDGLIDSTHVLVIISPASLKSGWVPYEVGYASGTRKRVLPLLTHPSLDLPGYLGDPLFKTTNEDLQRLLHDALLREPVPVTRAPTEQDDNWIDSLHKQLLEVEVELEGRVLTPHDVFLAVRDKLLTGVPAENLGDEVKNRVGLSDWYGSRESTPEPFDKLLAPLVQNQLVRIQRRTSGVRVVLFATDRGMEYGHSFS